jgi:hypothetical protein
MAGRTAGDSDFLVTNAMSGRRERLVNAPIPELPEHDPPGSDAGDHAPDTVDAGQDPVTDDSDRAAASDDDRPRKYYPL